MVVFFNKDFLFFILFFFLSFHFHPYTFHFFFIFFLFLVFLLHTSVQPPFFYFLFHLKNIPASHICFTSERERERELVCHAIGSRDRRSPYSTTRLPLVILPTTKLGQVGLFLFFFFFSYLLVLIQLYFKNWIFFCVLCFVFGLCEKRRE